MLQGYVGVPLDSIDLNYTSLRISGEPPCQLPQKSTLPPRIVNTPVPREAFVEERS